MQLSWPNEVKNIVYTLQCIRVKAFPLLLATDNKITDLAGGFFWSPILRYISYSVLLIRLKWPGLLRIWFIPAFRIAGIIRRSPTCMHRMTNCGGERLIPSKESNTRSRYPMNNNRWKLCRTLDFFSVTHKSPSIRLGSAIYLIQVIWHVLKKTSISRAIISPNILLWCETIYAAKRDNGAAT